MKKTIFATLFLVCQLQGVIKATTLDIPITTDTYVSASATSSNYGTGWYLYAQNSPSLLTLMKADLTSIPANATILKAELYLYTSTVTSSSSVFYFDKVLQSWGETTATYANKPTTTTTGRITKSGLPSTPTIDITTWAQGWYTSPTTNYGFQISAAASGNSATFYSAEFGGTTSLRPFVRIYYTTDAITWTNKTGGFYTSGTTFGTMYSSGTANSVNTLPANTDGVFGFTISTLSGVTGTLAIGLADPDNLSSIKYALGLSYSSSTQTSVVTASVNNGYPLAFYYNIPSGTACSIQRIGNNIVFKVGTSSVTYTGTSADKALRLVAAANLPSTASNFTIGGASFGAFYNAPNIAFSYSPSMTSTKNYIATKVPRIPVTELPASRTADKYSEDVRYFDGLGRPIETVSISASPTGRDIVTQIGYDVNGRQVYDYLPFTKASNNGAYVSGTSYLTGFYASGNTNGVATETSSAALKVEKVYESSPLDRVESVIPQGTPWRTRPVSSDYEANISGNVYLFTVTESTNAYLRKTGTYAAGTLYVTRTTDEDGHWTAEYIDMDGKTIMKESNDGTNTLRTYYAYDRFGLLRFVVSPKAVASIATGSTAANYYYTLSWLKELCYYYEYDEKKRTTLKRLPGSDPVYMVYDADDRLVLTQDGVQRLKTPDEWSFVKYDALDRPVLTGVLTTTYTVTELRNLFKSETARLSETPLPADTYLYTYNSSYPASVTITAGNIHTITYYDSYPSSTSAMGYVQLGSDFDVTPSPAIHGRVTVTKTRPIQEGTSFNLTNTFTTTKLFYDAYGRTIETYTVDYNNLTTVANSQYDFTGNLLKTQKQVKEVNTELVNITQRMAYDHRNRLLETWHQIGSNAEVLLAQHSYNELGQEIEKKTGFHNTYFPYLQYTDYSYNIRGWLTAINNSTVGDGEGDLFGMELLYNSTNSTLGNSACYNGNISGTIWTTLGLEKKGYRYDYDGLNRLRNSVYKQGSSLGTEGAFNEYCMYDLNGNIATLARFQNSVMIDDVTYHYSNSENGNKLQYVSDTPVEDGGLIDRNNTTADYSYDVNGNMVADLNKRMNIAYNYLNLPAKITTTLNTTDKVEYLYDAMGNKLAKMVSGGSSLYEYYLGGVVLKKVQQTDAFSVGYLLMPEGRVDYASGGPIYEYHLKDHLGNTRVAFIKGSNGGAEAVQKSDYYPFGLKMALGGLNNDNRYLYNGKELQDNLLGGINLDLYDYSARYYDPQLGRWHSVDPMAELSANMSPYTYGNDNPVFYTDPTGMVDEAFDGVRGWGNGDDISEDPPEGHWVYHDHRRWWESGTPPQSPWWSRIITDPEEIREEYERLGTVLDENEAQSGGGWDSNGDGIFQKSEADSWWLKGGGDVSVDNAKINWSGLSIPQGASKGSIFAISTTQAFLKLPYETAATYGGTSFKVISPSQVMVLDQLYHYQYRPNNSAENLMRNFMNWYGKPSGQGTDFMIHYYNPLIIIK